MKQVLNSCVGVMHMPATSSTPWKESGPSPRKPKARSKQAGRGRSRWTEHENQATMDSQAVQSLRNLHKLETERLLAARVPMNPCPRDFRVLMRSEPAITERPVAVPSTAPTHASSSEVGSAACAPPGSRL